MPANFTRKTIKGFAVCLTILLSFVMSSTVTAQKSSKPTISNQSAGGNKSAVETGVIKTFGAGTSTVACTLTCPSNVSVPANGCGNTVTFGSTTASGGCGPVVTLPASGSFFPIGTTAVHSVYSSVPYTQGTSTTLAILSQNFEPANAAYSSQMAEDFIVPAGQTWDLTQVNAIGQYFNGSGPATSFNVVIYSNTGSNKPGTALYTFTNLAYTQSGPTFSIAFPLVADLTAGTYWISVQANMSYASGGEWGWDIYGGATAVNNEFQWQNPGGGFGACPTWANGTGCVTASDKNAAFTLIGTDNAGIGASCSFNVTVTPDPTKIFVNDGSTTGDVYTTAVGNDATGNGSRCAPYASITKALSAAVGGSKIYVDAGTYVEDVLVNQSVTILGVGAPSKVSGAIGGGGSTFQVAATGVVIDSLTITREGNNTTDWNNPGLNTGGVSIQGSVTAEVKNCIITGNRTGIDINNSNGNNIHNNIIDNNRTGMIFRNQTDNTNVQQNFITNNWTDGIVFLDGSGGTNSPVQTAANSTFNNNNISGNWYGQVVDRQTGGSLPAPGASLKNFTCNWYGTLNPAVTTANSAEPGYAAQIPVAFGGTATAPGGQPDILGAASANITYITYLTSGTDNDAAIGFQPVPNSCNGAIPTIAFTATTSNGTSTATANGTPSSISLDFCNGSSFGFSGFSTNPATQVGMLVSNTPSSNITLAGNPIPATTNVNVGPAGMSAFFAPTSGAYGTTNASVATLTQTLTPYYDVNTNGSYDAGTDVLGSPITFTYNVHPAPTATISYPGSPYCPSGSASVVQTGITGGSYTAPVGVSINAASGAINLASSTPGTYTVTYTFTDGYNCTNTTTANITINPVHTITLTSANNNQTVCLNTPIVPITYTLGGGATGATITNLAGGLTYAVSGTTLTISGSPTNLIPQTYHITTTGNACATATASGTITTKVAPTFILNPSTTPSPVCVGGSATFTAAAVGTGPLVYQWKKDGVPVVNAAGHISGATSNTLSLTNVVPADAGNYTLTVSNSCAPAIVSNQVAFTVYETPVFTTCPATINTTTAPGICASAPITYTAVATSTAYLATGGTAPLTFSYTHEFSGATVVAAGTPGTGSPAVFNKGTTVVKVSATNTCGTTVCTFSVIVVDNELPVITGPANINVNNDAGICGAVVNYITPVGTDNCPGAVTVQTAGLPSGSTFPVGTTTNTFVVTDASGNTASVSFTVTVTDNENPTITSPGNITVSNDAGLCSAVVTYATPAGSDNCSAIVTQTAGLPSGSTFPVGTTTNTFVATDPAGHTATTTFTVTVNDTELPTITCAADVVINAAANACITTVALATPATGDNCGVASVTNNHPSTTFPVGVTNVIWTVTDVHGNTNTCTQKVTVIDPSGDIYVNDNTTNPGDYTLAAGSDITGNGTKCAPYATIGHAVSIATAGNTIYVDAGSYKEEVVINKSLTIKGRNAGSDPLCNGSGHIFDESVIYPVSNNNDLSSPTYTKVLTITANNVVIDGLVIDGDNAAQAGSYNAAVGIAANSGQSGIDIKNNIIRNFAGIGADLSNDNGTVSGNNQIHNNEITNISPTTGYGIGLYTGNNTYADIKDNCMTAVRKGIQGGENNYLANAGNVSPVWSGNKIESYKIGIWNNLAYGTATPVTITNNTITTVSGSTENSGIEISSLQGAASVTVTGNTVTGAMAGINLWNNPATSPVTVGANTFTGCNYGVFANNYDGYTSNAAASAYVLSGVNIQNSTVAGIYVKDNNASSHSAVSVQISNSTVINNNTTGLKIEGSAASASFAAGTPALFTGQATYIDQVTNGSSVPATAIDATAVSFDGLPGSGATLVQNFAIEDKINHKIDNSALGFVLVKAGNTFVTTNSFISPATTTASVQRAVDAATANDVVNVADGTYNGDVNVNKTVTVSGQSTAAILRGLYAGSTHSVTVSANNVTVKDVTITRDFGANFAAWAASLKTEGIIAENVGNFTLDHAIVTGNRNGVYVHSVPGFVIKNSTISDNRTGFQIWGNLDNGQIVNNFIKNNFTHGVLINFDQGATSMNNLQVNNNDISGNWYSQINFQRDPSTPSTNVGSTAGMSFTCNWYGSLFPAYTTAAAGGAGYGTQVPSQFGGTDPNVNVDIAGIEASHINYAPYLINGTDNSAAPGFQPVPGACAPAPTDLYVNDTNTGDDTYTTAAGNDATGLGTQASPFRTINRAISGAMPGNTIYVDGGQYSEDVIVDKKLLIRGANYAKDPNTVARTQPESVVKPFTVAPGSGVGIYIDPAAAGTKFDGFTIDGNGNSAYGLYADGSLANDTVSNNIVRNEGIIGVVFEGSGTPTTGNSIANNKFDNLLASSGIAFYNSGNAYTNVTNNVFTAVRIGVQYENFYLPDPGNSHAISGNSIQSQLLGVWTNLRYGTASVTDVTSNTFTNAAGGPSTAQSAGLRVQSIQGAATVNISNNTVTGNRYGVILMNNPTNTPLSIDNSTFTNNSVGVFATNTINASNNNADPTTSILNNVSIQNSSYAGIEVNDTTGTHNSVAVIIKGGTVINNTATGLLLKGSSATASFSGANPAAFTAQAKYIDQQANTVPLVPSANIDATAVTFDGQTGATATLAQNYAIEDKINHKIDLVTLGFVLVKANNTFVTTNSFVAPNVAALVQRGADAAGAGFIVNVAAGTYNGDIVVNKNLSFQGAALGIAGTASRPAESILNAPTVTADRLIAIGASNVAASFDGFKIVGKNVATVTDGTQSLTLKNSVAELAFGDGDNNIYSSGTALVIDRNLFKAMSGTNVGGSSSHIFSSASTLTATNNKFTSADAIPSLTGGTTSLPVWLNVTTGTQHADVSKNEFNKVDIGVLIADNASDVKIVNNDFIEAKRNTYVPGNGYGAGIALFENLTPSAPIVITNNNFLNSETGIRTSSGSPSNVLPANSLLGVHQNSFVGMSQQSIRVTAGYTGTLDATCNWYNTIVPSAIVATTSPQVNAVPFLSVGTDTDPAIGFQPAAGTCTGVPIVITLNSIVNVACYGSATGEISITATGGTGTLTYVWTNTAQTTSHITGLVTGTYQVTVSDIYGNTATSPVYTVTQPAAPLAVTEVHTNVNCNANTNGSIALTVTGGTSPYTYSWDHGLPATASQTNLAAGTYNVTVTDFKGCTQVLAITITQPAALAITSFSQTNNACHGGNTGTATINVTGGTPAYIYTITNVANPGAAAAATNLNNGTFTGLVEGTYTISATDQNGCTAVSHVFTITSPAGTTPDISLGSVFSSSFFPANGSSNTIVYNITEVKGNAAGGVTLRIQIPNGYDFTFNPGQSSTMIGATTYVLDNSRWTSSSDGTFFYLSLGANQIPCSQRVRIAVTMTRNTTNVSTFSTTSQLLPAINETPADVVSNGTNILLFTGQ